MTPGKHNRKFGIANLERRVAVSELAHRKFGIEIDLLVCLRGTKSRDNKAW